MLPRPMVQFDGFDSREGLELGQRVRVTETRPSGKTKTATGTVVKLNDVTFRVRTAAGEEFNAAYPRYAEREMARTPGYFFEVEIL